MDNGEANVYLFVLFVLLLLLIWDLIRGLLEMNCRLLDRLGPGKRPKLLSHSFTTYLNIVITQHIV